MLPYGKTSFFVTWGPRNDQFADKFQRLRAGLALFFRYMLPFTFPHTVDADGG